MSNPSLAVLCDFDGTISTNESPDYVLEKYATDDWKKLVSLYANEEIDHREFTERMEKLFSALTTGLDEIIAATLQHVKLRNNFGKLVDFCHGRCTLAITSLGLDFVIKGVMRENGWTDKIKGVFPTTRATYPGIVFQYPELNFTDSVNLKDDAVTSYKKNGMKVVYLGNGYSDLPAATKSDVRFAVKGSKLSELCRRDGIAFHEFSDFNEVMDIIGKV